MFDFAWSELGLIAAVALVLIGPKDLPVALRSVSDLVRKARRMASEFQSHVDEMVREANLGDVRDQFNKIRNFDIRSEVAQAVDPDNTLRDTFASNPLEPAVTHTADGEVAIAEAAPATDTEISPVPLPKPAKPDAPAFVPPSLVPALPAIAGDTESPAFIPPGIVLQPSSRQFTSDHWA
jgi:sec-independent protein translocase protein TatB